MPTHRPAQHMLQPTALSLRFSTTVVCRLSPRSPCHYSSGGRLSFSVRPLSTVVQILNQKLLFHHLLI
jgi:hypothetical protein